MKTELLTQLLAEAGRHAGRIGFNDTGVENLSIVRREHRGEKRSFANVYAALVLQGTKHTEAAGETYRYRAGDLVVNCLARPTVTYIDEASPEHPYLSIVLTIEREELFALSLSFGGGADRPAAGDARTMFVTPAGDDLADAYLRLLRVSDKPEAGLLGPIIKREIYARLLLSPLGEWLREVSVFGSRINQIASAVERIRRDFRDPISVEALAAQSHMSPASFHRHFKSLTGVSPLQYQKALRLNEARRLIASRRVNVSQAAFEVGYVSPSQFSSDYRLAFGRSPRDDAQRPTD